jgi:hypothetical protein
MHQRHFIALDSAEGNRFLEQLKSVSAYDIRPKRRNILGEPPQIRHEGNVYGHAAEAHVADNLCKIVLTHITRIVNSTHESRFS